MKLLFNFGLDPPVPPGARRLSINGGIQYINSKYLPFKVGDVIEFGREWYAGRMSTEDNKVIYTITSIKSISDMESSDGHLIAILDRGDEYRDHLTCCFSWFKQPHIDLRKL